MAHPGPEDAEADKSDYLSLLKHYDAKIFKDKITSLFKYRKSKFAKTGLPFYEKF